MITKGQACIVRSKIKARLCIFQDLALFFPLTFTSDYLQLYRLTVTPSDAPNPATAGLKMSDTTRIVAAIGGGNQEPSQQNCSSAELASDTDIDTSMSCHSGTVIRITGLATDNPAVDTFT